MTDQWRNIFIALIVLIVIYVINQRGQQNLTTTVDTIIPMEKADVFSFTITKGDEEIELMRMDTLWFIVGHDSLMVKPRIMENFLDQSLSINRESLVSNNHEKWSTYSVDDSGGTRLSIYDENGDEKGWAIFGKSTSEWSKNFVRVKDENNVYQTDKSIIHLLQTRPTYWGEKPKPPEQAVADSTGVL